MELFFAQLFNGIGSGVVYASVALALVLIYRTTGLLNFAQGEMALASTYLTVRLVEGGLNIVVAIVVGMVASFALGAAIERFLIRPLGTASPLNVVIVTIGMFLGINAIVQLIFGTDARPAETPFPDGNLLDVGPIRLSWYTAGMAIVLMAECAVLWVIFQKTKVGLALRAVAGNEESARLVGIPAGSILMLGWAMAAALGALAGPLVAADKQNVSAAMMQIILVYAFAAAAIGGFDSPVGAVVGGLIVGVSSALAVQYADTWFLSPLTGWLDGIELALPLLLTLLVLLVKPTGLFGKHTVERV